MREFPNPQLRASLARKIVALANAILEGRTGLVVSAPRMNTMLYQIGVRDGDESYDAFRLISSETDHLPIAHERQYWERAALARKDLEIARAELWAREFGLDVCRELAHRFAAGPSAGHDAPGGARRIAPE